MVNLWRDRMVVKKNLILSLTLVTLVNLTFIAAYDIEKFVFSVKIGITAFIVFSVIDLIFDLFEKPVLLYMYDGISIERKPESIIKPENLHKHIGEILTFHNGKGYIVTACLEDAKAMTPDLISYYNDYGIEYGSELDMSYLYSKDDISKYETYMYAYVIRIQGITNDEIMHNIKYVTIPTREELDFRRHFLEELRAEEIKETYEELKETLNQ